MAKKETGERVVYDVPTAGALLGLSRNASYEAAARGEIPTIKIGKLLKVPKIAFDNMLMGACPPVIIDTIKRS
jgi:hypothetical protein